MKYNCLRLKSTCQIRLLTLATALPEVKKPNPIHGYFRLKIYIVLGMQVDCLSTYLLFHNIKQSNILVPIFVFGF